MQRDDCAAIDCATDEETAMRPIPMRGIVKILIAMIPALAFLGAALMIDLQQRDRVRLDNLSAHARHVAEAVDLRLSKLLELIEFCASSPSLVTRVDFEAFAKTCGRYADMLGSWVVLIELGDTHRQVLNTRVVYGKTLPSYPREQERPPLLELEARSRASGTAEIAEVFEGRVLRQGVLTAARYVMLGDGRASMLYVSTDVKQMSRLLGTLAGPGDSILALVDRSHRVVARSAEIDRYLFTNAPGWLADSRSRGEAGSRLNVSGPSGVGGSWDAGYHPLRTAPGWMAAAVVPRSQGVWPPTFGALAIVLTLFGVILASLLFWGLGYRDRAAARVAEAERARADAERANREKSKLLASLAHDIRSPLLSLLGSLELAMDREGSCTPDTRGARRSAEALLQLVDDILELSYLGSETFTLALSPVDLRQLAEDLIERLRNDANRKGLSLHLMVAEAPLPVVMVDRLRLEQVLGNLLSNAIKYTNSGSVTLRLAVAKLDGDRIEVTFAVSDTGIGISSEDFPKVFREFGRLEWAVASGEPGTGLGLAICQRILRSMGSELSLKSVPGEGSVFAFTLRMALGTGAPSEVDGRPLDGMTILYAEDEAAIRAVTGGRLAAAGASVIEAENGTEALEKLATIAPDLILLDLQMPKLDGVETIRCLRAMQPPVSCPVCVLTSYIAGSQAAAARAAGADEIFTKPVQIMPLAMVLRARRSGQGSQTPEITEASDLCQEPLVDEVAFGAVMTTSGEEMERTFLPNFEGTLRGDLAEIGDHTAGGRNAEASRIAHRSRGLCQVFGARRLAALLRRFEMAQNAESSGADGEQLDDMHKMLGATLTAMRRLCAQDKSHEVRGVCGVGSPRHGR